MMVNSLPQIEEGTTTTPWSMVPLNQGDGLLSPHRPIRRTPLTELIPFLFSLAGRSDIIDKAISLISIANPNPIGVKVIEFPQKHALMCYIAAQRHELRSWCRHMNRSELTPVVFIRLLYAGADPLYVSLREIHRAARCWFARLACRDRVVRSLSVQLFLCFFFLYGHETIFPMFSAYFALKWRAVLAISCTVLLPR